jgi:GGDEF domain-containing protein
VTFSARWKLERDLAHQAFHDALTQLPNRTLFGDRLEHALVRSRAMEPLAVMLLDLDGFKAVNDTLGHTSGDELLAGVAERLLSFVRRATPSRGSVVTSSAYCSRTSPTLRRRSMRPSG